MERFAAVRRQLLDARETEGGSVTCEGVNRHGSSYCRSTAKPYSELFQADMTLPQGVGSLTVKAARQRFDKR
jgi:hypothetical protein